MRRARQRPLQVTRRRATYVSQPAVWNRPGISTIAAPVMLFTSNANEPKAVIFLRPKPLECSPICARKRHRHRERGGSQCTSNSNNNNNNNSTYCLLRVRDKRILERHVHSQEGRSVRTTSGKQQIDWLLLVALWFVACLLGVSLVSRVSCLV